MSDLKDKALKLIDEFYELDLVKRYLRAKELYENSSTLKEERKEIQLLKSKIPSLEGKERDELISYLKDKEEKMDLDPNYVTYINLKEEVYSLIRDLELIFK